MGEAKIYWPVEFSFDVVKSLNIISIALYHDGSEVQNTFLTTKGKVNQRGDRVWDIFVKVIFGSELKICLLTSRNLKCLRSFSIFYFSGIQSFKTTMASFSKLMFHTKLNDVLGMQHFLSTKVIALFLNLREV